MNTYLWCRRSLMWMRARSRVQELASFMWLYHVFAESIIARVYLTSNISHVISDENYYYYFSYVRVCARTIVAGWMCVYTNSKHRVMQTPSFHSSFCNFSIFFLRFYCFLCSARHSQNAMTTKNDNKLICTENERYLWRHFRFANSFAFCMFTAHWSVGVCAFAFFFCVLFAARLIVNSVNHISRAVIRFNTLWQ